MKRARLIGLLFLGAALLSGCPIYPEERLFCETSLDCPSGYACDPATGYCVLPAGSGGGSGKSCDEPKDCGFNQTCSAKGVCKTGDCSFHGCVSGYTCVVDQGAWTCVSGSGGTGGGDAGADADAASGGSGGSTGGAGGTGGSGGSGGSAGDDGGGDDGGDASSDASGGGDAAGD